MAAGPVAIVVWAIVGGTVTSGDPEVVAIARRPVACGDAPVVICTGVLVAPRVVLTAAHCIDGIESRGSLEVIFGDAAAAPSAVIVVQETHAFAGHVPATGDGDLAVLLLADAAPVAPIARPTGSAADLASSATLRAVGFGVTAWTANDPGTKREGTMTLGAVRSASFDAAPGPAMTCTADSGGPVFATIGNSEQLVGVTSKGDAGCVANAVNARVDVAFASFIDPAIASSTSAPPGWPPAIGFSGACTTDIDCPALMTCSEQQRCSFPWLGDGSFDASCVTDGECGSARCVRVWPSGSDTCRCFTPAIAPPGPDGLVEDPPEGCCSGSGGGTGAGALLLLALARAAKRKLFHARDQRRA